MKKHIFVFISFLVVNLVCFSAKAGDIYIEYANEDKDIFEDLSQNFFGDDNSDGNFTQGLYLSYTTTGFSENHKVSYSIEQDIFTPSGNAKRLPRAVVGNRPFAGYLGIGLSYTLKNNLILQKGSFSSDIIQHIGLKLGVIGSDSKASEFQDELHDIIDATEYNGWEDQVKNKYGGIFSYYLYPRLHYKLIGDSLGVELSPHAGLSAGNLISYAGAGFTVRIGSNLTKDYGPKLFSLLSSGNNMVTDHRGFSWHLFFGVEHRYMDRNYLLEGRTGISGLRTVAMRDEVTDLQVGGVLNFNWGALSLSLIERSREFETQANKQQFLRVGFNINI